MIAAVSRETECFKSRLEAQLAEKAAGRRRHVFHGGEVCSGCYQEPPLPGQRYGANCNRRAALASYHKRKKLTGKGKTNGQDAGRAGAGSAPG